MVFLRGTKGMIAVVSIENAHLYGDIIPSIYRLRYHGFKERQNYDVPSYRGMEFDAYDTPATTYLAWRDEHQVVRGCARVLPTTMPYMIEDLWPQSVQYEALPKRAEVWEASRMCIDKNLPVHQRRLIHAEIVCALQEFGLMNKIDWMIGVMTLPIWRSVFMKVGWPIEFLGPPLQLSHKEKIFTGKMRVSKHILKALRQRFLIDESVIEQISEDDWNTKGEKIHV